MRRLLCGVALVLSTATAAHAQWSVQVHGLSKHTGTRSYNEVNSGLSLRHQVTENVSYQAGFYRNSYNRTTVFVAANVTPIHVGRVALGGFAGVGTGYDLPVMGGALAVVEFDRVNVTLRAIPKFKDMDGVVAVEFGVKF